MLVGKGGITILVVFTKFHEHAMSQREKPQDKDCLVNARGLHGVAWDRVVVVSAVMRIMTQQSPRIKMLVNIFL